MNQPIPKHIHLIGICGTAMASLAGMLQAQGHRVTGSDAASYPPMNGMLAALGIPILEPYAEDNLLPPPDLVVVGNAISRGNPELEYVLDHRLPLTSMATLLHAEFLAGRETLVVAGTHGKTTTTSMLAWIYQVASRTDPRFTPSFLIGGVAENFSASFQISPTNTFLIEGDEYDTAFFDKGPKFLHYFPHAAILTHVEFDHADIYADLDQVKTAFRRFVNLIPRSGRLVAFDASPNVSDCIQNAFCTVERYGFAPSSGWRITDLEHVGNQSTWTLHRAGAAFARLTLPMAGEHNVLNATAAAALAAGQGVPPPPSSKPCAPSKASSAASKSSPKSPALQLLTTLPTTPPPSAKPSAPCAAPTPAAVSGPFSNLAPTPSAAASSSSTSSMPSPSRTRSSSPPSSAPKPFPSPIASIPKSSLPSSPSREPPPPSPPMPTQSSLT